VNIRYTTGILIASGLGGKSRWTSNESFYYQGGHDRDGLPLSAYMFGVFIQYRSDAMSYLTGWDYSSGNDAFANAGKDNRFDPLYGTPHKFHGFMDYFYSVSGSPAGGLNNPYVKIKFTSDNERFSMELDNHYFFLANKQKDLDSKSISKYLGTEFDLTTGYKLNKFTTVDLGFSYLAATSSMEFAKNLKPDAYRLNSLWAYLQLNIKPEFLVK
jgi:hypothetical protein